MTSTMTRREFIKLSTDTWRLRSRLRGLANRGVSVVFSPDFTRVGSVKIQEVVREAIAMLDAIECGDHVPGKEHYLD